MFHGLYDVRRYEHGDHQRNRTISPRAWWCAGTFFLLMRPKLPAMQWYPRDWKSDLAVQSLTFEERGIWWEILQSMHMSEEPGKMVINGQPMKDEEIAHTIHCPLAKVKQTLSKALSKGLAKREGGVTLVNPRMVYDEEFRRKRKQSGSLGGKQKASNRLAKGVVKATPSYSALASLALSPLASLASSVRPPGALEGSFQEPSLQNSPKGKKAKKAPEGYKEAVEFLLETWKPGGSKYLFGGEDGKLIKDLLGGYGLSKTKAILKVFWEDCDEWIRTKIGRNARGLRRSLDKILDSPRIKELEKQYDVIVNKNSQEAFDIIGDKAI